MLIMLLAVIGLVIVGWSWSKLDGITDYWVDQGKKWQIINLLLEHKWTKAFSKKLFHIICPLFVPFTKTIRSY